MSNRGRRLITEQPDPSTQQEPQATQFSVQYTLAEASGCRGLTGALRQATLIEMSAMEGDFFLTDESKTGTIIELSNLSK